MNEGAEDNENNDVGDMNEDPMNEESSDCGIDIINQAADVTLEEMSKWDTEDDFNLKDIEIDWSGKVAVVKFDITKLKVDAIVNAANTSLMGGGGVDGSIHKAAGPELKNECQKIGYCEVGDAKLTKGYKLNSKYVIHTVGPTNCSKDKLKNCYLSCLELAKQNKIKSIAFPCISTGCYGFPIKEAAAIAFRTVTEWITANLNVISMVTFCTFDSDNFKLYDDLLKEKTVTKDILSKKRKCKGNNEKENVPISKKKYQRVTKDSKNTACVDMNVETVSSVVDKIWNLESKMNIIMAFFQPDYKIHKSAIQQLQSEWLNDDIISASLQRIVANYQGTFTVNFLEPSYLTKVMAGGKVLLSKSAKDSFRGTDIYVGIYNTNGNHWELLVIYPKTKLVIWLNPMGELDGDLKATRDNWRKFTVEILGETGWSLTTEEKHSKQQDSDSCAIYCLLFAECYIKGDLPPNKIKYDPNGFDDIDAMRRNIAEYVIEKGSYGDWCKKICRVCGSSQAPKIKNKVVDSWVQCQKCNPPRWYHQNCLVNVPKKI